MVEFFAKVHSKVETLGKPFGPVEQPTTSLHGAARLRIWTKGPSAVMVTAATKALKERGVSSRQAINMYILANYKIADAAKAQVRAKLAIRKMLEAKTLLPVKGSFKLPKEKNPAANKPAAKKAKKPAAKKTKKPAAKKPAAKKPTGRSLQL